MRSSAVFVKVNFLALDFDLTILDIHTSGRWPGTPEQLAQRIRPFFQVLIPVAIAQGETLRSTSVVWRTVSIKRVSDAASKVFGQVETSERKFFFLNRIERVSLFSIPR